jgi:DNA-binding winged helix-turn-helix (wHTH) protein/tetratricopeptide (TPR) repeat protein
MTGRESYGFGEFTLDVAERRLSKGGTCLPLSPKAHDVLVTLVRRAGHLVTKRELLERVWPESFVEEGILAVHVSGLRKALGNGAAGRQYIETVPGSGYRFIAAVTRLGSAAAPARSPALYELVGRGRAHLLTASLFDLPQAVVSFKAAIDLDPTYAAAHAGHALACCAQAELRTVPHTSAYGEAKAAALRALAMDDSCADAQVALGAVLFFSEWDWMGAERSLIRALELNPQHSEAMLIYGRLLEAVGQLERGLAMKQQALERDPFSPLVHVQIAQSYWHLRRYDEAIVWANRALEIDPQHLLAREFLVGAYWRKGDFDRMFAETITHAETYGARAGALEHVKKICADLQDVYATGGRPAVVAFMIRQASQQPHGGPAIQLAVLSGETGDLDSAFHHLGRAIDARDPSLVHLAVAPQWDPLRGDPRFANCLERLGLNSCGSVDQTTAER